MKLIMQSIVEEIIKKKMSTQNIMQIVGLMLFLTASSIVLLMLREALHSFILIFIAFIIVMLACAYYLITILCVEYEYRIIGDELTIDKITAYKIRKNIVSLSLKETEAIGSYVKSEHEYRVYNKKIIACEDIKSENTWYITTKNSYGKTFVVMTPSDKFLEAMKRYIPKQLAFEVFVKGHKT